MNSITGMSPTSKTRANGVEDSFPDTMTQSFQSGDPKAMDGMYPNQLLRSPNAAVPSSFFDDGSAVPLTWDRLVEDMRLSVERYRHALNNRERAEYVRRAEDISDHLRLLLAAGSSTTDNHSGNPSIISTNKALYPHFRDMMSRFSKLVLSSHIAAADWPQPDACSKCLLEADGVLQGVFGYVEVARSQRGEDIPRLVPGFLLGSTTGGGWQNNGLGNSRDSSAPTLVDDDFEQSIDPSSPLDATLLERLDELKKPITTNLRRLDERLVNQDKLIGPARHETIAEFVCLAGRKVIDCFRPYISTIESTNLGPLGSSLQNPTLADFAVQKQRLYDLIADLVVGCQTIAGPIADEWTGMRGDALDERLMHLKTTSKQLDMCTQQIAFQLQLLMETMPQVVVPGRRKDDPNALRQVDSQGTEPRGRSSESVQDPMSDGFRAGGEKSKVKQFFGEEPITRVTVGPRNEDETPWFLGLDHVSEISYDAKTTPATLRGGTLRGLVEQLTRHDRLDSPFNNTFLLTYRSFTTATDLFDMLVQRFSIQPPGNLSNEDLKVWGEKKQKPIRFRVVNILKSWFDSYWMEGQDSQSQALIKKVYAFANNSIANTNTPGVQQLMTVVDQRQRGQESNSKRLVLTLNTQTPQPIMPKNMKKLKFLDIDVTEFARQLTIIESRLYGKIKPTECLNKTWQRKDEEGIEPAENVKALILHSNQLTNWVAEMILTQQDVKKRVVVIKHFIGVAEVSIS
jgi:son of sevenless